MGSRAAVFRIVLALFLAGSSSSNIVLGQSPPAVSGDSKLALPPPTADPELLPNPSEPSISRSPLEDSEAIDVAGVARAIESRREKDRKTVRDLIAKLQAQTVDLRTRLRKSEADLLQAQELLKSLESIAVSRSTPNVPKANDAPSPFDFAPTPGPSVLPSSRDAAADSPIALPPPPVEDSPAPRSKAKVNRGVEGELAPSTPPLPDPSRDSTVRIGDKIDRVAGLIESLTERLDRLERRVAPVNSIDDEESLARDRLRAISAEVLKDKVAFDVYRDRLKAMETEAISAEAIDQALRRDESVKAALLRDAELQKAMQAKRATIRNLDKDPAVKVIAREIDENRLKLSEARKVVEQRVRGESAKDLRRMTAELEIKIAIGEALLRTYREELDKSRHRREEEPTSKPNPGSS